jgi:glycine/D-amino acid oxidase-like deaminating enzyme
MDLHSGAPYWLLANGLEELGSHAAPFPDRCDVAIIGAGVTGALVADRLSAEGLAVVVFDRRAPGEGSTAASTALLSYELDVGLRELSTLIGEANAGRAYQLSARAIQDIATTAESLPGATGFARCPSVCLATRPSHARKLVQEVELRRRHGLDAEFWPAARVREAYGFPSHGALRTAVAGVIDPVRLTRLLLCRAVGRGAALISRTEAREIVQTETALRVITDRGETRAGWVVYAMGYEVPPSLRPELVALHSTYALVTEPLENLGPWDGDCIVWETSRPYYYMRATADRRVMIGGADAPFQDADRRDRLMPSRTKQLERRLGQLLPGVRAPTAFEWAGTFAETRDGLPFIGPAPGRPRTLYALGYGANGITFGAVAARILGDLCLERPNPDAALFRLDRSY